MRSHKRLRSIIESLVGGAFVACGGGVSTSGFDGTVCDGNQYEPLTNLTPATPVDYIELRNEAQYTGSGPSEPWVQDKFGTPCATATNVATCTSTLAALRSPIGFEHSGGEMMPYRTYVVYTRGDNVAALATKEDVAAFF